MKVYLLPENLYNGLVNWMQTKPYGEVAEALGLMSQLQYKSLPDPDLVKPEQKKEKPQKTESKKEG